jgi:hypothetical protein
VIQTLAVWLLEQGDLKDVTLKIDWEEKLVIGFSPVSG